MTLSLAPVWADTELALLAVRNTRLGCLKRQFRRAIPRTCTRAAVLATFTTLGSFLSNFAAGVVLQRNRPSSPDPSRLGSVEDVNGASVSVKLSDSTPGGLLFVNGEAYRIGQVGGFVRIPSGYV